jgi:CRP-like cAMP-binding protein
MDNGFRLALHHLDIYMKRHVAIITKSAESRLANELIRLATSVGRLGNSGIVIDINNEELGSLSDVGHFTTSRILSKWERDGILSKQRGELTILAPESLVLHQLDLKM